MITYLKFLTLPSGGFFFHTNGHNPNPFLSIDIIVSTLRALVVVLGGVCLGDVWIRDA